MTPSPRHPRPPAAPPGPRRFLRLVAYDIADPKRLAKTAALCLDYGIRVEKSLFECDLPDDAFEELWSRLLSILDPAADSLLAYSLCRSCRRLARSAGLPPPRPGPSGLFLF